MLGVSECLTRAEWNYCIARLVRQSERAFKRLDGPPIRTSYKLRSAQGI
jgi:hypothetical protein